MAEFRAGSEAQVSRLDGLVEAGLLVPTGVHGVYARGGAFEEIRLAFDALVTRTAAPETPEVVCLPADHPACTTRNQRVPRLVPPPCRHGVRV